MWEEPLVPNSAVCMEYQGGNFHLKVEGAKSSGNAGDPMLGVVWSITPCSAVIAARFLQ